MPKRRLTEKVGVLMEEGSFRAHPCGEPSRSRQENAMDNGIDVDFRPLALTQKQAELIARAFTGRPTEADLENLEYLAVECLDESGCGLTSDNPWEAISSPQPAGCLNICGAFCLVNPDWGW